MHSEENADKAFLTFCIEVVLLRMGTPQYEKTIFKLEKDYKTYLSECDKNPEALKQVLQDTFGSSYHDILNEIKTEIGEIGSKKYYTDFILAMTK